MSGPGNKPAKTQWVRFLAGSGTETNQTAGRNPDHWRATRIRSQHFSRPLLPGVAVGVIIECRCVADGVEVTR